MHHGPVTTMHEVTGLGITTLVALFVFGIAELLKVFTNVPTEWTRKVAHIGAGGVVLMIPLVISSHWTVAVVAGGFAILMAVTSALGLLSSVHGVGRGVGGVLWYPFTAWLMYFIVFDVMDAGYVMYAIPVLVLATADALGALVGKSYGRMRYRVTEDHQRSIEGTLAVFGTAFLCVHIPLLLSNMAGRGETLLISFTVAMMAAMLETVSVYGLDNFLMPFGTLYALNYLLPMSTRQLGVQLGIIAALATMTLAMSWRRAGSAGGTVSLLLSMYAMWATGGIAWLLPLLGLIVAFVAYERLSPVNRRHTRSRYGLGTAVAALATPIVLAAAYETWDGARLHHILYAAYLASLACSAATIFFMLPQNHTFRFRRLRRSFATRDLWQYAPTPGKLLFALIGAALPAALLPAIAHAAGSSDAASPAVSISWGLAGLVAFVAIASVDRRSHQMCPACGGVSLRGLFCCQDNQLGGGEARESTLELTFRETYLIANTFAAACAAVGVIWLT